MNITFKVQYGQRLYKMSPHINTLEDIQKDLASRYPNHKLSFIFFYNDVQIQDFELLKQNLIKQGVKSIKIVAKSEKQNNKSKLNTSYISMMSKISNQVIDFDNISNISKISQKKQQPILKKQKIYEIHRQFYQCYNCEGFSLYEESGVKKMCEICYGQGQFENDHKYVLRMKKVLNNLNIQNKIYKQEIKEQIPNKRRSIFKHIQDSFDIIANNLDKKQRMQINIPFTSKFQILNIGSSLKGKQVRLFDSDTLQSKLLSSMESNEKISIQLGPFICKDQTTLQKKYYLCYKQGNQWIKFGHKFGFSTKGYKPLNAIQVKIDPLTKIRSIIYKTGSKKSQQYLLKKLQSMGINMMKLQIDEELLCEIVKQIK